MGARWPAFILCQNRDISGPKYEWAMKMGQWHMSHAFACKNQDFDGPFRKK